MQYRGGACWIKVTFDAREAADRALAASPHRILGHWVYAQPYHGQAREPDEPIVAREEERVGDAGKHLRAGSWGGGGALSLAALRERTAGEAAAGDEGVAASSTASSATALEPDYPDLRQRKPALPSTTTDTGTAVDAPSKESAAAPTFSHFPSVRRTELRPATEAFLPQPTWTERMVGRLTQLGWIPGDVIGNAVPLTATGAFDAATASLYWKVCYWLDCTIGTDLCGLREG